MGGHLSYILYGTRLIMSPRACGWRREGGVGEKVTHREGPCGHEATNTVRNRYIKVSHWVYWRGFCGEWGVYAVTLGALGANTGDEERLRLNS